MGHHEWTITVHGNEFLLNLSLNNVTEIIKKIKLKILVEKWSAVTKIQSPNVLSACAVNIGTV